MGKIGKKKEDNVVPSSKIDPAIIFILLFATCIFEFARATNANNRIR